MDIDAENMHAWLDAASDDQLNALPFGVIAIDHEEVVVRYNDYESRQAKLSREEVLGRPLFLEVAPCMNNALVARRFTEATEKSLVLDAMLDYVLAFRSRLTPVKLRLLSSPISVSRYVLIKRLA